MEGPPEGSPPKCLPGPPAASAPPRPRRPPPGACIISHSAQRGPLSGLRLSHERGGRRIRQRERCTRPAPTTTWRTCQAHSAQRESLLGLRLSHERAEEDGSTSRERSTRPAPSTTWQAQSRLVSGLRVRLGIGQLAARGLPHQPPAGTADIRSEFGLEPPRTHVTQANKPKTRVASLLTGMDSLFTAEAVRLSRHHPRPSTWSVS